MRNQIHNVFNSAYSEISMFLIVCCMIATTVSNNVAGGVWTDLGVASGIVGAVILVALLVWATVMLATKRQVKEMAPRPRVVLESCSRLLLLYWLCIASSPVMALIFLPFILWDGIRSVRLAWFQSAGE